MYSGSEDKTVKIWDWRGASGCQRNFNIGNEVTTIDLHPNQAALFCGCQDGNIRKIDLVSDKEFSFHSGEPDDLGIRSVSVHPNGSYLAASGESGKVYVWRLKDGLVEMEREFQAHDDYVLKCLFSPNGRLLATTSADSQVSLWDTSTWKLHSTLEEHREWVWDCAFSFDSNYLLTGASDRTAILWELAVGVPVRRYQEQQPISAVSLNDMVDDPSLLQTNVQESQNVKIVETISKTGKVIKRAVVIT
eukprot:TRINITY_DN9406_c0_g3_i3.p1 TRINITY_DN9406_c0_g3~~TRINITY_DN9406_c0_g3_i3.p1  ORF type:complete len:248 (-),score=66.00 TRINITY_DN9406_c0_g3_i3:163-906(-)